MEVDTFISLLKMKFSEMPFFVRIFIRNNKIIIWNDVDIEIKINFEKFKNNINTVEEIIQFVQVIHHKLVQKIEAKYADITEKMITVIVPNYNNEMTIVKTINSILDSTYPHLEVIIVDDCSTDDSVKLINENFGENPKVRLFQNKENKGTYFGRNKGLLFSKGYYITFVDGDDYIDSNKFEYEINVLEKNDNYWGFGTGYERIYYDETLDKVVKHEKLVGWIAKYVFRRKLYNYIGFYANSRYSADSEFMQRSRCWGYELGRNQDKVFYHAYTTNGKNLTQTITWPTRAKFISYSRELMTKGKYIPMALLDELDDFLELLNVL